MDNLLNHLVKHIYFLQADVGNICVANACLHNYEASCLTPLLKIKHYYALKNNDTAVVANSIHKKKKIIKIIIMKSIVLVVSLAI